jgi:hypothetical protein
MSAGRSRFRTLGVCCRVRSVFAGIESKAARDGASRGLSLSIGLILRFRRNPSPWRLDYTNDGLTAGMHVHVLDGDLLLALAAVPIQRVEQHREGAGELASLIQVFMPQAGRVAVQGDRVAVHRGIVAG